MTTENSAKFMRRVGSARLWQNFLLPTALAAAVGLILVPLPAFVMDLLLSLNLSLAILVLLTTIFVRKPLDFSTFPSLLLAAVMFRLGLNIATTRMILSNAEEEGTEAAGLVIQAFSNFVASGNLIVGAILFLIILVIQFVVITKGAGRISEVNARFTLDGLPGKQMAIDAELQAGSISREEAQRRRAELGDEVDFYGAMDGASKFVRGDAVAGLCITLVNVCGGIVIGMSSGNHTLAETVEIYTRLTIGDGLVSQIPAFLVAIAAAMLVTRSSRERNLSEDLSRQLFSTPMVVGFTGAVVLLLALTPLPTLPLVTLGIGCGILAVMMYSDEKKTTSERKKQQEEQTLAEARNQEKERSAVRVGEALLQDAITLEIGSELVSWTDDASPNSLTKRLLDVRRELAHEFGFLMPAVRITSGDSGVPLDSTAYRIRIQGTTVAEQVLRTKSILAVEGVCAVGTLEGLQTTSPVRHLPAVWIAPEARNQAEEAGYEVFTPAEVLAAHLKEAVLEFASELLTRDDVQNLLNELAKSAPTAVKDVIPARLDVQEVQQVLQRLLAERVPIRSLGKILETLGLAAARTHHPTELAECVRASLGRLITSAHLDADGALHVLTLLPDLEAKIAESSEITESGGVTTFLDPSEQQELTKKLTFESQRFQILGVPGVLLVSPQIRPFVREMTLSVTPPLPVLSLEEVPRNVRLVQENLKTA